VFDPKGATAYLGTNSGLLGSKGLSVINVGGSSVSGFASTPGKVLAVSPDSSKVVVSDTVDSPNQVFVFDTSSNIPTVLRITGATAADFSPDSLKAFIVAGNTLYVYSKLDALVTKPLTAPAIDVSFLAEGAFGYLAGGSPAGVTVERTCDISQADTVNVAPASVPTFLKTLPDATGVVALMPPEIGIIKVSSAPTGCSPSVSNSLTTFDLGRGNFVASQLIISEDGSTVYIVTPNFNSILVFNITGQTSSAIPLIGTGLPLRASLTPDGTQLYVGSSDGTLHLLQTDIGADIQQISFPQSLCQTTAGQPFPGVRCNPDLVAVKP
jgi:WD40 repeat protein